MAPAPGIISEFTREVDAAMARAALAKTSLRDFCKYRYLQERRLDMIRWGYHLDYLCEVLEAARRREILRLIVCMPPRNLKTETLQSFAAYTIGRDDHPRSSFVCASYSAGLSYESSRKTRELVQSGWFQDLFGGDYRYVQETAEGQGAGGWRWNKDGSVELKKSEVKQWVTERGAGYVAAGVGGELTGKGGDFLIGDDLLKPIDANSETMRDKTCQWLGETFASRLNNPESGAIIHIAQRLHERDPLGWLMDKMQDGDADQYTVVRIPLIAEKTTIYEVPCVEKPDAPHYQYVRKAGEVLDPDRYPDKVVRALKKQMGANFDGQYQQRPTKMEGDMLRPSRIRRVPKSPQRLVEELGLRPNFCIDGAVTESQTQKDDPDWSVILVAAQDRMRRLWLLDCWRGRVQADEFVRTLAHLWKTWRPHEVFGEKGWVHNVLRPELQRTARKGGPRIMITGLPLPQTGDAKVMRAHSIQPMLNTGQIFAAEDAPWFEDLRAEMAAFPRGAHDDQVDTLSMHCMLSEWLLQGSPKPKDSPTGPSGEVLITGEDLVRPKLPTEMAYTAQQVEDARDRELSAWQRAGL